MNVPTVDGDEVILHENLSIVAGFKCSYQNYLVCVFESDAIVWHGTT